MGLCRRGLRSPSGFCNRSHPEPREQRPPSPTVSGTGRPAQPPAPQEALVCMFLEAASIALTLAMRSCTRRDTEDLYKVPVRTWKLDNLRGELTYENVGGRLGKGAVWL